MASTRGASSIRGNRQCPDVSRRRSHCPQSRRRDRDAGRREVRTKCSWGSANAKEACKREGGGDGKKVPVALCRPASQLSERTLLSITVRVGYSNGQGVQGSRICLAAFCAQVGGHLDEPGTQRMCLRHPQTASQLAYVGVNMEALGYCQ